MNNFGNANKGRSSSSSSSSSGLVQSHSVTAQFNALSVDVENFRNAKQVAQGEHGKVQESLHHLKQQQAALLAQIRMDQEALGTLTRKRDMFGNEKARLVGAMDRERKALEACAKHSTALGTKADAATRQYANEMGEASNEAAGYLEQEIHAGALALLSVESVQEVLAPKIPNEPRIQHAFYGGFQFMRNGKESLDKETARHALLRRKYDHLLPDAATRPLLDGTGSEAGLVAGGDYVGNRQQRMDLFYGLNTTGTSMVETTHA